MWEGDLSFFLPAVPSALLLHSVPPIICTGRAVPKGHWPPLPSQPCRDTPEAAAAPPMPHARRLSPRCVTLRCPCAATRVLKDVSRAEIVWGHHWGNSAQGQGQVTLQCPHGGTQTPHPGVTQALGSSLAAPGCSSCPTSSAEPPGPVQGHPCWASGMQQLPSHQAW